MIYFINMDKFFKHKYTLPAILLAAFILRLIPALSALSESSRLVRPDSSGYLEPARALADYGTYPTTKRPPGYPLLAAAVYSCELGNGTLAMIQVLLSTAACAVTASAASCYAGKKSGNIAALLMACNITAIANAPLLLSDTLFSLFAALQFLFFIRYYKEHQVKNILFFAFFAAVGTLIRPINQLMWLVSAIMIFIIPGIQWKKKFIHVSLVILIFAAVTLPWMYRNYCSGSTFDIDSNTGAMRHQNGAMLMAKVNNSNFESEKQKLLKKERIVFSDTAAFPTEREKEQWRKKEFITMVKNYPFTYFIQHFDLRILLPDIPSFMENFGITASDRGTMGILKKDGLMAAVKHYFGANWFWFLVFSVPLILPVMFLFAGVFCQLAKDLFKFESWKTSGVELMIFCAFAEYYLFLPGAITAPRYQLPALPCLCTLAACAIATLLNKKDEAVSESVAAPVEV